jgi:hypothetical protein
MQLIRGTQLQGVNGNLITGKPYYIVLYSHIGAASKLHLKKTQFWSQ